MAGIEFLIYFITYKNGTCILSIRRLYQVLDSLKQVVHGFGHGVLRITDPRYTTIKGICIEAPTS